MRYAKSKSCLVLAVTSREVERLVSAAVRHFVPRYARKLYFLGDAARGYPELERLAEQLAGFTIVRLGAEPSNLISSFRIVHHDNDNELIVVLGVRSRFPEEAWESVIRKLENVASPGDSAV